MSCSVVVWLRKCPIGGTHPLTIDLPAEAVFGLWDFREIFVSNKGKTEGILEKNNYSRNVYLTLMHAKYLWIK